MSRALRSDLLGRTGLSLAIRLAGIALNFLALLVLARALDPAVLGAWAWAIEVIALLGVLAGLGFNMIAIRVVPDCLIGRDLAGLLRFVRAGLLAALLGSLMLGAGLLLAFGFGWLLPEIDLRLLGLLLAVLLGLTVLRFLQEVMRGAGRIVLAQVFEQSAWPAALLLLAIGLWLVPAGGSALIWLLGTQLALFAVAAVSLGLAVQRIARDILLPGPALHEGGREWLAGGVPLALCAALSVVLNRGDLIALGVLGDASAVALYTPASRYAALLVLGQAAASMAAAGRMRVFWRAQDWPGLQHCLDEMAAISVLFALPLCALFWLVPGTLLNLFGDDFVAASRVLQVLTLAQLINCWTGPVASMVVAAGLERLLAFATAGAVLLQAALLVVLVPRWGMTGAAMAALAGLSALNLSMAWLVWRRTGLICWARLGGIAALLAAIPSALMRREAAR